MDSVSIIIPTHNDFSNIGKIAARIHGTSVEYGFNYEMIFVDDHSSDLTRAYITQLKQYYPIRLLTTRSKTGKAAAIRRGISHSKYDVLCVLDASLVYPPEAIPAMLGKLKKGADIVVADKPAGGEKLTGYRRYISKFVHNFGFDVRSGLKVWKKSIFQRINLSGSNHAFALEFLNKSRKAGLKLEMQPVEITENVFGKKTGIFEAAEEILKSKFHRKYRTKHEDYAAGTISLEQLPQKEKPKFSYSVTKYTQLVYSVFALACVSVFGAWWFQPTHIPHNFTGEYHFFDVLLFALVSYIIWHPIIMDVLTWSISSHIKAIKKQKPEKGLSVAFITTIVPSSESLDLLHKCLPAMVKAHYKHDTWLLDEGHSPEVQAICDRYGVLYFSRKGVSVYNTKNGGKFTKTKGGNHNSWYDMYGNAYDIVAQIDTDFVPKKTFLTKTLGYFKDPEVAFVGTPQVYGNTRESIVARGAAEQLDTFYGSVLRGLSSMRMTLLIGANHIIRSSALKGVDHYSAHITEDLITGMKLHTKGWKSVYLSEALAIGEGPATWEAYFTQQMRWAYGCMDIFFRHSFGMFKKMGFRRSIYYFFLQQHYFSGIAMALSIVLLSLYFVAGLRAADIDLFKFFLSYSFIVLICWLMSVWLQRFNVARKRFGELQIAGKIISIAAWPVWFLAFLCVITGKKISYKVTPKGEGEGVTKIRESFSSFYPHMVFGLIALTGIGSSFITKNQSVGMMFWASLSAVLMLSIPFAHEIAGIIVAMKEGLFAAIRSVYDGYHFVIHKLKPRRSFIHNTARQNTTFYSRKASIPGKRDVLLDSAFLSIIMLISMILYIHQIGFYSDDWSFLGNFSVSPDQSLWGLIQTAFTPNTLMRPVQNIYDALLFWLFGTEPLGYQLVNAGVLIGITVMFYLIMRQLKMPRIIAVSLPLVFALLPNYSTDRFWFAVFQANLSMLFYFISLFAAIRAVSFNTVWSSHWKVVSIVSLILSALSYEIALPLSLLTILILLNPFEVISTIVERKKQTVQKDVVFIAVILISLVYIFLFKTKTTTRLNDHLDFQFIATMITSAFQVNYGTWVLQIPHIWGQAISLYATPVMLGVAVVLYIAIFWFLFYVLTRPKAVFPGTGWMLKMSLSGFVVFLLGYAIFFTNNQVGFSPTGIDNRVAIAAAIGVAMTLIGGAGFFIRLLPQTIGKAVFALFVALVCTGGFLVINTIATFWSKAYQSSQIILADIYDRHPKLPSNSTLILDGVCPYVGPAPVFEAPWDLKGALQAHYKDASLKGDIVTPRMKVKGDSLETQIYTFPANYPYDKLYIYNFQTKQTMQIKNSDEAHAYFNSTNPDFSNGCPLGHAGKGVPIF